MEDGNEMPVMGEVGTIDVTTILVRERNIKVLLAEKLIESNTGQEILRLYRDLFGTYTLVTFSLKKYTEVTMLETKVLSEIVNSFNSLSK